MKYDITWVNMVVPVRRHWVSTTDKQTAEDLKAILERSFGVDQVEMFEHK